MLTTDNNYFVKLYRKNTLYLKILCLVFYFSFERTGAFMVMILTVYKIPYPAKHRIVFMKNIPKILTEVLSFL